MSRNLNTVKQVIDYLTIAIVSALCVLTLMGHFKVRNIEAKMDTLYQNQMSLVPIIRQLVGAHPDLFTVVDKNKEQNEEK